MAGEIEPEDDVLELGDAPEATVQATEGGDPVATPEDDDADFPTFADASEEEESDTDLVRHLRAELRKTQARTKELEQGTKPEPEVVVGDKPTLESCDYDEDKFEAELDAYKDRQRKAEEQRAKGNEAQQQAARQWQDEQADYLKKRTALPFKPEAIDDAETTIAAALDPHQIAIIVKSANNAPALNLALSRHPAKLAAIAGIKDYVKFTAAVVRLEAEVKMPTRRPVAEPDKIVRGSGSLATTVSASNDKLITKASAGGDVTAEMKALRDARRAKRAA